MTSADLQAWMERHGFNKVRAASEIGITRKTLAGYLDGSPIPRQVALACSAISHGLPPMGSPR